MDTLGATLERTLCLFKNGEYIMFAALPMQNREFMEKCLLALLRRGYIESLDPSIPQRSIQDGDWFRISVEGIDYLERNRTLWRRLWEDRIFRLAPIIISFMALVVAIVSLLQALHWLHLEKLETL